MKPVMLYESPLLLVIFSTLLFVLITVRSECESQMICTIFTHTIPFPHLSQTGSFCRFPVGGAGLVVGAFTVLVTMGRVPAHMGEKPLS